MKKASSYPLKKARTHLFYIYGVGYGSFICDYFQGCIVCMLEVYEVIFGNREKVQGIDSQGVER